MLRQRQTLKQGQRLRLRLRPKQRLRLKQRQRQKLRLKQRQRLRLKQRLRLRQRATHGLRWLKIYMALKVTTTLLCENMSSVMLMLMLSQLGLCKTTVYTEASKDVGFPKNINKHKLSDEHCKAGKKKKSNAND